MLSRSPFVIYGLLLLIIIENATFGNFRGVINLIRALIPLLIFMGVVTFIFANLSQAIRLVLRLIAGALAFSFYFAVTNPSDLTRTFEKLRIPSRLALLPALSLSLVPRIAKDAEETFETLLLRGEIKGHFFQWIPRTLAIFIASVLYRSEFLSQSIYYRGFGLGKRTHYKGVKIQIMDILRLIFWTSFLIGVSLYA